MAHEPTRWSIGLLPLGLIWVVGSFVAMDQVEPDLRDRGASAIGAQRVDNLKVAGFGRDVFLSGAAFTPQAQNEAIAEALGQSGVRLVEAGDLSLIPEAKPYVWRAERKDGALALSGSAPNPAARAAIVDTAHVLGGLKVSDAMQYSRAAADGFQEGATLGVHELGLFSKGSASLTDDVLAVTGEASSGANYDQALDALKTLPKGVKLGKVDVAAPLAKPFAFGANWDGSAVQLTGVAPSQASREAMRAAAAADFPGANIVSAVTIARGAPQGDFDGAGKMALSALSHLALGSASLTDGALALKGDAATGAGYDDALSSLKTLPAGASIASVNITPPLANPFVFSASSAGGVVRLTGSAPSVAERDALVAEAGKDFPGARIENTVTIARGEPPGDFDAAARTAVAALAGLTSGEATLEDGYLALSGKAGAPGQIEALAARLGRLPAGFAMSSQHVEPPSVHPYVLDIVKGEGGVTLSGFVPDETARQRLQAAAAVFGAKVTDHTQIASGLPAGFNFDAATNFTLSQLALLKSGAARLSDASLSLHGEAPDAHSGDRADAAFAAMPAGLTKGDVVIARPAPPAPPAAPASPPAAEVTSLDNIAEAAAALAAQAPKLDIPACDAAFKDALNGATIEFASGKADVTPKSYALVVKLAGVALRCEVQHIEVSGHTDSQGDAAMNQKLSELRAGAIVSLLGKAGVPTDKLSAVGYGATKPVASNDTDEGRAANRRIEFSVQ